MKFPAQLNQLAEGVSLQPIKFCPQPLWANHLFNGTWEKFLSPPPSFILTPFTSSFVRTCCPTDQESWSRWQPSSAGLLFALSPPPLSTLLYSCKTRGVTTLWNLIARGSCEKCNLGAFAAEADAVVFLGRTVLEGNIFWLGLPIFTACSWLVWLSD